MHVGDGENHPKSCQGKISKLRTNSSLRHKNLMRLMLNFKLVSLSLRTMLEDYKMSVNATAVVDLQLSFQGESRGDLLHAGITLHSAENRGEILLM